MIRLYYSPGACSMASHIALEETGQPYELQETLLSKDAHKTPEYLAVNPRGKVPALVVDDKVITENTAILTYIGRRFPHTGMLPEDPIEQSSCHFADGVVLQHAAHFTARDHAALPFRFAGSALRRRQGNRPPDLLGEPPGDRRVDRRSKVAVGRPLYDGRSLLAWCFTGGACALNFRCTN